MHTKTTSPARFLGGFGSSDFTVLRILKKPEIIAPIKNSMLRQNQIFVEEFILEFAIIASSLIGSIIQLHIKIYFIIMYNKPI